MWASRSITPTPTSCLNGFCVSLARGFESTRFANIGCQGHHSPRRTSPLPKENLSRALPDLDHQAAGDLKKECSRSGRPMGGSEGERSGSASRRGSTKPPLASNPAD